MESIALIEHCIHDMCIIHWVPSHSSALTDGQSGRPQGILGALRQGALEKKNTCPIQEPSLSPLLFGSRNCRMSWWKVCCNIYIMVLKFQGYSVQHISYTYICYYIPTLQNNRKPHRLRCNIGGDPSPYINFWIVLCTSELRWQTKTLFHTNMSIQTARILPLYHIQVYQKHSSSRSRTNK